MTRHRGCRPLFYHTLLGSEPENARAWADTYMSAALTLSRMLPGGTDKYSGPVPVSRYGIPSCNIL
ncbi:Uncharacterised protein [Salmonella enterica subsp. enterica]|nr:Uncharacterised protein [Salmonella enterica subsp. enterica] [Salmonella enterica subsp. enterica serovar Florida]